MEESSSKMYKTIFSTVKSLDDKRKQLKTPKDLLASCEYEEIRQELIEMCEQLMVTDFENYGRKARDILWRKGYYESISIFRKVSYDDDEAVTMKQIEKFLVSGICQLKKIVLTFDKKFSLDLKDTINIEIFHDKSITIDENMSTDQYTMNEICYAWDIVHLTVISLGDIYRYFLNFKFSSRASHESGVDRETVAEYYREAFKLNGKTGLAQNQLGTLYSGEHHELDSMFHYLFALACKEPCELSEANVNRIFQKNAAYLEESKTSDKIKNFVGRFILIIDIFYYDKDVTDFCDLCHSFLIDLKYFLDAGERFFTEDILFKITSILLFCLDKLKKLGSKKVHSLNAVLVALVSEFIDITNRNFELFKSCKEAQNLVFNERYNRIFEQFEEFVAAEKSKPKIQEQVEVKDDKTPESGSSNKENATQNGSQNVASQKTKDKRRQNRRRRAQVETSDSEDDQDDLNEEKFHFSSDSDSNVSFESYDQDDSEDSSDDNFDATSDSGDEIVILEEELIPPEENHHSQDNSNVKFNLITPFEELSGIKFRKAYKKIDPNIIFEFCEQEKTLKSLKILFNWLDTMQDVLVSCYVSNPEFIHKIMRLVNFINVDIFTRKVFFDRSFIEGPRLRLDLRYLFDIRNTIPVEEDVDLKNFTLIQVAQEEIDWEIKMKLAITKEENSFLRLFKIIDFGFHLSKMRKFHYYFCAKTRVFIEKPSKTSGRISQRDEKSVNGGGRRRGRNGARRDRSNRRDRSRRRERKGYLKNRDRNGRHTTKEITNGFEDLKIEQPPILNGKTTGEKMGELWLRSEVKLLEKKMDKNKTTNVDLTPYIVLDTKALVDHNLIVKSLARSKKFVILIPSAVLSDLDDLKKGSETVRNTIKWLEQEFTKGNRFIRSQRPHESLPITLLKIPKKLDRDAATFIQIVQFCNFIVTKNVTDNEEMITFLTGENMVNRCFENFSCSGILNSIPVKYEQITCFHAKYKHKK